MTTAKPNAARSAPAPAPRAKRVVVVGGGLAGLASAVELAGSGFQVTLIERNKHLGGKMNLLSEDGFTFDMGPTILTLPQVLRGIIRRAASRSGRTVEDYIDLINLDPQWRCHFEDGVVIDLRADEGLMAGVLDAQFPKEKPGAGYKSFVAYSRRMMRLSEKVFYYKDLGGVADMMKTPPKDKDLMGDVLNMRMHSTVAGTIQKHINEPHVRQVCEHFLQYVGSSPFLAPAILSLIAAAQVDHGCWYSMAPDRQSGGTRCVARALERLLHEQSVTVITGVGVKRLQISGDRATGVMLDDGRTVLCDAVVSNCDVQRTYRDLVGTSAAFAEQRSVASKYTPACSGLVLYLGLTRQYDHLAHHNFLFSKSSHDEFDDIYARGIPARDPTIYLAVPSRTDPTQAPPGCEAFYALIHTPYLRPGQTWESNPGQGLPGAAGSDARDILKKYRPVVIEKLKRFGMPDLEKHIKVERFLTPQGIERMYNAEGGAIYGLASHGRLRGGFKPKNTSPVLSNLFLAGGSVNPGPGVPMVLMSGVTAARSLMHWAGQRPDPLPLGPGLEPTSRTVPSVKGFQIAEPKPQTIPTPLAP